MPSRPGTNSPSRRTTNWQQVREEAAGVFLDLARDAAGVIATQLQHYRDEDRPLKPHEIREVATAMGIASDKAAHLLFGPQGVAITVDARQQTVGLPAGMTVEEARELAAALRAPPAPHAAGGTLE